MAHPPNPPDFLYRIHLPEGPPVDIRMPNGTFNSAQPPPLVVGDLLVDAGIMSRQSVMKWAHAMINELQSLELKKMEMSDGLWNHLIKLIQNLAVLRHWILVRPRLGPLGLLSCNPDLNALHYYTPDNVLDQAHIIWREIEQDLGNESEDRFLRELLQEVYGLWQFKVWANNMLCEARGLPHTTQREIQTELARYSVPRNFSTFPQLANPQPIPTAINRLAVDPFNPADSGSNTTGVVALMNQQGARQLASGPQNANNLHMTTTARGGQYSATNAASNQYRAPNLEAQRVWYHTTTHAASIPIASNQSGRHPLGTNTTINQAPRILTNNFTPTNIPNTYTTSNQRNGSMEPNQSGQPAQQLEHRNLSNSATHMEGAPGQSSSIHSDFGDIAGRTSKTELEHSCMDGLVDTPSEIAAENDRLGQLTAKKGPGKKSKKNKGS